MTAVFVVATFFTVVGAAVMFAAFVWGARKDGEEDRALQERLGIHRRTRIGR